MEKTLNYLELGIVLGYLAGETIYEIKFPFLGFTRRSQLKFPLGNWLIGGRSVLRWRNFRLSLEGYTPCIIRLTER
ncbi:MAG: hypothetical protein NC912_06270 [Candidatus Omnitrophica bacterium]|nr:hypothetical protein [Candidatus Omnitrophota bacterium]